jgi:PAS domain S-box-containing protein
MRRLSVAPSGREVSFGEDEIIVSKTDLKGHITYANDVFQRVSGYREPELIGQPHNLIRHPDMPMSVFGLLWSTLAKGEEIFAYVLNQARNGDGYWVFAHVTPSRDASGRIVGYHSNRRVPYPDALPKVKALYAALRAEELRHPVARDGMAAATAMVVRTLAEAGVDYSQFVFGLSECTRLERSVA